MAEVSAAALYASLADRWEGSKTVDMKATLHPVGNVQRIAHVVSNGVMTTTIAAPSRLAPFNEMANLPASARRLFLREVQP